MNLVFEIGLAVFTDNMVDQGDGNDQGQQATLIVRDQFEPFLFFVGAQMGFEIAGHMVEHIPELKKLSKKP